MAVDQNTPGKVPRARLTNDVNGLFFVFGVLAVMMVALPCPIDASSDLAVKSDISITEMKR